MQHVFCFEGASCKYVQIRNSVLGTAIRFTRYMFMFCCALSKNRCTRDKRTRTAWRPHHNGSELAPGQPRAERTMGTPVGMVHLRRGQHSPPSFIRWQTRVHKPNRSEGKEGPMFQHLEAKSSDARVACLTCQLHHFLGANR